VTDEPQEPTDPYVGIHYRVAGYVSAGGITPIPDPDPDRAMTFTEVVQQKPADHRFAIGQMFRLRMVRISTAPGAVAEAQYDDEPSGPFIVWDLEDDQLRRGQRTDQNGFIMPPPPMWMGETKDGMVMKALALYEALKP
jgi:hypothetical protein